MRLRRKEGLNEKTQLGESREKREGTRRDKKLEEKPDTEAPGFSHQFNVLTEC
jgi:hypothetical protein